MAWRWIASVVLTLSVFPAYVAHAEDAQPSCAQLLAAQEGVVSTTFVQAEMAKFDTLSPEVKAKLGPTNVKTVLEDAAQPLVRRQLADLLNALRPESSVLALELEMEARLELRVPPHQVSARVNELHEGDPTSLWRALGYKTLSEMQELVYGQDPAHPSPESLIGRYLAESNAAHLERQYPNGPTPEEGIGAAKLTIALSPQHRDLFLKYFNFPEIMMHYHTATQGTLLVFFNGQKISYSGSSVSNLDANSFTQQGMLLPFILLSSAEANRMANYVQLARLNQQFAKLPWMLPGYCAAGGYNSCTHWFGEIPIGDLLLNEYSFPGRVDQHATNNLVPATEQGPQSAPLRPYWEDAAYQQLLNNNMMSAAYLNFQFLDPSLLDTPGAITPERYRYLLDHLTRMVWQVPGHEQMGDVLGEREAKHRGEFANPGYVVNVLTGRVTSSRVPVVFYTQGDDQVLDPNFPLNIRAY